MKKQVSGCWLLMLGALAANVAMGATSDDDFVFSDGEIERYKGGGAVEIPSEIDGEKVTSIGDEAFGGCSGLTSVTIPEGVESIGCDAFRGCSDLTSVTIPASVWYIDEGAFSGCTSLAELHIDSIESWCEIWLGDAYSNPLGDSEAEAKRLFVGGEETTALDIPADVTDIPDYAFRRWSMMASVTIPEDVAYIGDGAFSGCTSLAEFHIASIESWFGISLGDAHSNPFRESKAGARRLFVGGEETTALDIPADVTYIPEDAFYGWSMITSVTIPASVWYIDEGAFSGCTSLAELHIDSIESWSEIWLGDADSNPLGDSEAEAKRLFAGGEETTALDIPADVTDIPDYAFCGWSMITSVTIPEGVGSIGKDAFWDCSGLRSVTIPASVGSIGAAAFGYCTSLERVTVLAKYPPEGGAFMFTDTADGLLIFVPEGCVDAYKTAWKKYSGVIQGTAMGDKPESVPVTPGVPAGPFDTANAASNAMGRAELAPSEEVAAALGSDAARATYRDMFEFDVVPTSDGKWAVEALLKPTEWTNVVESAHAATRQIPIGDIAALGSGEPTNVTVEGCVPGFYYTLYGAATLPKRGGGGGFIETALPETGMAYGPELCGAEGEVTFPEVEKPSETAGFFSIGASPSSTFMP